MVEQFRASDGYEFAYRHYPAMGKAKAHIVFVHGIRSHSGWYVKSCTELAKRGFDVSFLDRRGAGLNEKDRGDCPSFRRLLDDVIAFIADSKTNQSQLPIVVAGISWGGKIAAAVNIRKPGTTEGIVLITPGIVPLVSVPFAQRLRIVLSRFVNPTKPFPIPLNDPELFTAAPAWQRFIDEDGLSLRNATARFLFNSVQLDFYLRRGLASIHCPMLVLSAGRDKIADPVKSVNGLKDRISKREMLCEIVYADSQHTLEFEANCPFVEDIAKWCETVLARS